MLNSENNRFPNSAELFLLCKEILNIKQARGEKVTDQDVGSLLDFDPADCTHWKYGRKNIKSIQSLQNIADKLSLDFRSISDVAQGKVSMLDTLNDFQGYGQFECDPEIRTRLLIEANSLVVKANIQSLPVFIPELLNALPGIIVKQQEALDELIEENFEEGAFCVSWMKSVKLCGSLRFHLMKRIGRFYLSSHAARLHLDKEPSDSYCNLFALLLLMPTHLLQLACCQGDPAKDVIDQFSHHFWLSRSLVNTRLKDFLFYKN
jgi:hypothetical protein